MTSHPTRAPRGEVAARLLPELRSFHVSMAKEFPDVLFVYDERKYDAPRTSLPDNVVHLRGWELVRLLRRPDLRTLEMWEPLWVRCLARHIRLTLVWCLPGRGHGWRRVSSYAMENNELPSLVMGDRARVPGGWILTTIFRLGLGVYMRMVYRRIAFAGEGSRDTYAQLPGVAAIESRLLRDLPARLAGSPAPRPPSNRCVFVGRLEARKGIKTLLAAWERVEVLDPTACLDVVGDGPEGDTVHGWAASAPARRRAFGALVHDEALEVMRQASVLVLPSEREGRWREQIGLPIREALQAGMTVVTTTETGLAEWLRRAGHHVVPPEDSAALASSLAAALAKPLDPADVRSSLPDVDGEYAATMWFHDLQSATTPGAV